MSVFNLFVPYNLWARHATLKGPVAYALILNPKSVDLTGFADADWTGSADRSSTTGNLMQLGGATIYWKNITQKCIVLSSTEAEYVSLALLAWESTCMRGLLCEVDAEQSKSTKMYEENAGLEDWASDIGHFAITNTLILSFNTYEIF